MEKQLKEVLKTVLDPEIGINIVDLGLVYRLAVLEPEQTICVDLTLTTPGCPMSGSIVHAVEEALKEGFPGFAVRVQLVWLPLWGPERISAEGLALLGG